MYDDHWHIYIQLQPVFILIGASRYYDNLEMMIGYRINPWLRICWLVLTPILTCVSPVSIRLNVR